LFASFFANVMPCQYRAPARCNIKIRYKIAKYYKYYMHFVCLANTLLKDEQSARDNQVLDCIFAKKNSPILIFSLIDSTINLS